MAATLKFYGHLKVWNDRGEIIVDADNMFVTAGLAALVDALHTQAYINTFKYVGFGTGTGVTEAADTALETEVSGGTYARLTATQGEGALTTTYRLSGVWTNNSGGERVVTEYGIFSAASTGTLLSRVSTADTDPPESKTVASGGTLTVQWDIALATG